MSALKSLQGESLKIIFIIMLGWSGFSFADATTKYITGTQGYDPATLLTFGSLVSTALIIIWILFDKGWRGFLSPNWKWLIARGASIAVTATAVVNAVALIPLADLYGITFSAPFISVFLAYTLLKEEVGLHRWLAVLAGFLGVFILAGPQFNTLNIGLLYAIAAAISIALGTIVIRKIGKNEYLPLFILYPYLGILTVNAPMALPNFELPPLPALYWFIANTVFVLGAQLCTTFGISNAKSIASIAPFVYLQVVWGTIFGFWIFGDIPTTPTIIGLTLIIGAGIYMIYRERQLSKVTHYSEAR